MISQRTLIIGANSSIAKAIALTIQATENTGLILIRRDTTSNVSSNVINENSSLNSTNDEHLVFHDKEIIVKDYQSESIEVAIKQITIEDYPPITRVFICNGILHSNDIYPEKRIEEFDVEAFQQVMTANALTPMLWIQKLIPLLTGKSPCKMVVFSARVGSISDNRLGGWYSYRASKAALNMMIKTASIELARRAKNIKLIAFHPGTTDTPLSKPFHKNVPAGKLFTCEYVAKQLLTIVEETPVDQTASYLGWNGETINW
ncbi:SDR family NAD(P)-dependent oxidoreductase [Colwellia sp. 12G3]|uniref:SDR family NAD(P)-dependent oxidoreductase n=1 Tax=Colwellia sp. 12G3 TaxID=2058299 RepID=UPI000C3497E2|nr:SDR family NAD(P)-dependent oxidoreductase [Colwellia sp. 12G3]PKI17338.1 short-chain dehydrogenase [Colwellia sp. 12G3]